MNRPRLRPRRRLAVTLAVLATLALGFLVDAALMSAYLGPRPRVLGPPPAELGAEAISFTSSSGAELRGWYLPASERAPTVLLMHGVRGTRESMLPRARFLHQAGYAVLLFDFQSHGESSGEGMSFGLLEARDARAALDEARRRTPGGKVAALGSSLGGVACLLGPEPLDADALILEAVYPTLEDAVSNRLAMRLGAVGRALTPLLLWRVEARTGIAASQMRPVERIGAARSPVLVIYGSEDEHTTPADSRRLLAAAPAGTESWALAGARHVDFHRFAGAEYERRVLAFLERCLRDGTPRPEPGHRSSPGGTHGQRSPR